MPETEQENKTNKGKMDDNTIFIGMKPFMNYVTAVVMQITTGKSKEVKVLARGKWICRAVDVVEVAKNRFLEGTNKVNVKNIEIGSEQFKNKEGRDVNVSTIEITIAKESNQ